MKIIPSDDLIKLITISKNSLFSENNIAEIFDKYGDDWYIMDGQLQLAKLNEERNRLLKD